MFLSVVVPCYRSGATLPALVARLFQVLPKHTTDFEVVLVVDGPDVPTWIAASKERRRGDRVRVHRLSRNIGQHNALVAGVRAARYDVVVTMDDDLRHRPEEIPVLIEALTDDVDLVYGVSDEEHDRDRSLAARLAKAALERTMSPRGGQQISDFRAFRTFLRDGFDQLSGPHAGLDRALSWGTTRMTAVPVRMGERARGRSGDTLRLLVRHTLTMVAGYSSRPLRLVTYLGLLTGAVGLILFALMPVLYFAGRTGAGSTTIASMVALFSAAQMIAIGVLGEYVGRTHSSSLGLPTYVLRPVEPPAARPGSPIRAVIGHQPEHIDR